MGNSETLPSHLGQMQVEADKVSESNLEKVVAKLFIHLRKNKNEIRRAQRVPP